MADCASRVPSFGPRELARRVPAVIEGHLAELEMIERHAIQRRGRTSPVVGGVQIIRAFLVQLQSFASRELTQREAGLVVLVTMEVPGHITALKKRAGMLRPVLRDHRRPRGALVRAIERHARVRTRTPRRPLFRGERRARCERRKASRVRRSARAGPSDGSDDPDPAGLAQPPRARWATRRLLRSIQPERR
jgi:hypothetical protein